MKMLSFVLQIAWLERIGITGKNAGTENRETAITITIGDTVLDGMIYDIALLLEDIAGTGNWLEGKRLNAGVSEDEIKDWTAELGISSEE